MSKCKIKANIIFNALKSTGVRTPANIAKSVHTKDDVLNALNSDDFVVGVPNEEAITADQVLTAKALEKVDKFEDYGLIVTDGTQTLSDQSKKFVGNLHVSNEDSLGFINTLTENGYVSPQTEEGLYSENGKTYSIVSDVKLNSRINMYLNRSMPFNGAKRYVTKKANGEIVISPELRVDYNNFLYAEYLKTIGEVANEITNRKPPIQLSEENKSTHKQVEEEIAELRSSPVEAHINVRLGDLHDTKRKLKEANNLTDATASKIDTEIIRLNKTRKKVENKLSRNDLTDYFIEIITDVEQVLSQDTITLKSAEKALKALDLIANAAQNDEHNTLLTKDERRDKDFMITIFKYEGRARLLRNDVNVAVANILADNVKTEFDLDEFKASDLFKVGNLTGSISKMMQRVRGMHRIDNALLNYIFKKIEAASIRGFRKASLVNDAIEKLYRTAIDSGFKTEVLFQRGEDGNINGRMTDVFSETYWKNRRKLTVDYDKRMNETLPLNPEVLFESPNDDPQRRALEKALREDLGGYMYRKYTNDARTKWENYKAAEEVFLEKLPSPAELETWRQNHSPVDRISNYKNKISDIDSNKKKTIRGSDQYLVIIPRKTHAKTGKDLKYYDTSYKSIMESKEGRKLYEAIRENFIATEMAMNREYSKFKPPLLGYVSKSVTELVKKGQYGDALELAKKKAYQSNTTGLFQEDLPRDPITNKITPKIKSSLHSIEDEIKSRVDQELSAHPVYTTLDKTKLADRRAMTTIRENTKVRVAKEVESERSNNFLDAITLTNYATSALIEKVLIETEINMASNLMLSEHQKFPGSNSDIFQDVDNLVKQSLTHYLGVKFFEMDDKAVSTFLDPEKAEKQREAANNRLTDLRGERGVATRNLTKIGLAAGRVLYLGWSPISSFYNLGHGLISNAQKALSTPEFSMKSLLRSYGDIMLPKNRALIDKLYILGDIAFMYDKSTLHARGITSGLNPMMLQTQVEKINQGAVAIAIMKNSKVKNSKTGEVTSTYNAIGDDGTIGDEWVSEEYSGVKGDEILVQLTVNKIRPINMEASGDYLTPLLLERQGAGKLALQFKKFLPEMIEDRFGSKKYNYMLGRDKVGRYRGALSILRKVATGRRADVTKAEEDAARATIAEIIVAGTLKMFAVALTNSLCTSPECRNQQGSVLFALNAFEKLASDGLMFIYPKEIYTAVTDPFALNSIVVDMGRLLHSTSQLVIGSEDAYYKKDTDLYDQGDPKALKHIQKFIPAWRTNYIRAQVMSNKLMYSSYLGSTEDSGSKFKTRY